MVTCPYDKTHKICKSMLVYHLVQNRNNSSERMQCPFDACHVVDKAYFEKHVLNCASSGNNGEERYSFNSPSQLGTVPLETIKNLCVPIMEDWKEENVATYDPWESTEERNIIRCLVGGTKSKRKKFKLSERLRIQKLEKESISNANLTTNFKHDTSKKLENISHLIKNLKLLSLNDIDILLKIDINRLFISEANKENTFVKKKHLTENTEKMLVQKFKKLCLFKLKE